jgi:hypothetical protein
MDFSGIGLRQDGVLTHRGGGGQKFQFGIDFLG